MIYDYEGRRYKFLGSDQSFTHMECLKTKAYIKIANDWFTACGFTNT